MQSDRAAEVVDREPQLIDAEVREEEVERAAEEVEAIADAHRLVRGAEAGKVERDNAIGARDRLHDLAPEERGRRPPVQEEHRRPVPELPVGEPQPVDLRRLRLGRAH